MNQFYLQGVVKFFDAPEGSQKSGVILLKTGVERQKTNNPLQIVNSCMVRVPTKLERFYSLLNNNSTVEIRGRMQGIMKRTPTGDEIMDTELVAEGIYSTQYMDTTYFPKEERDNHMVNFFIQTGKVKHYEPPKGDNPKSPGKLYLLYGPLRQDGNRSYEFINMIVISVFSKTVQKKAAKLKPGAAVEARGHSVGLLKTIPGTSDSHLSITIVGDYIREISVAQESIGAVQGKS